MADMVPTSKLLVCGDELLRLYPSENKKKGGRLRLLATFSSLDAKKERFVEGLGSANKILVSPTSKSTFPYVICAGFVLSYAVGLSFPYLCTLDRVPPITDSAASIALAPAAAGVLRIGHLDRAAMKYMQHTVLRLPLEAEASEIRHARFTNGPALVVVTQHAAFVTSMNPDDLAWTPLIPLPMPAPLRSPTLSITPLRLLFFGMLPQEDRLVLHVLCAASLDPLVLSHETGPAGRCPQPLFCSGSHLSRSLALSISLFSLLCLSSSTSGDGDI